MTLRDVAGDRIRRQEPAKAQHAIWAERAAMLRTDRLTGLSNSFGWDEAIDEAMFAASRFGGPLIVARVELDQHGEAVASAEPLVRFATRARRVVRNADLFARLDGDVLVVALTRCPAALAPRVLERIRLSVADGESCSVGWVLWDREEPADELVQRASDALQLAKNRGGDQIFPA